MTEPERRAAIRRLRLEAFGWKLLRSVLLGWQRLRAALGRLFYLPGRLVDLPPEHPHRFFAAQIVLYVGIGIILLAAVLR